LANRTDLTGTNNELYHVAESSIQMTDPLKRRDFI